MSGPTQEQLAWLFSHDTGASSKVIWRHMVGHPEPDRWANSYPVDPDDLGRCIRLLEAFPEWSDRIAEMADGHGPKWAALVGAWDELVALYHEESPSGTAPRCYRRMREILRSGEIDP